MKELKVRSSIKEILIALLPIVIAVPMCYFIYCTRPGMDFMIKHGLVSQKEYSVWIKAH